MAIELTWPLQGHRVRVHPEDDTIDVQSAMDPAPAQPGLAPVQAFGAASTDPGFATRENLLIEGDGADVMASLLETLPGGVDLVYADPPFNTGKAKSQRGYMDKMEHGVWLAFMEERLRQAWALLKPGGSLYLHVDPIESHYAKVLLDDIFGREAFVREIIWRIGWISGYKSTQMNYVRNHDVILYYVKAGAEATFVKTYVPYPKGYKRREGAPSKGGGYPLEDTWNASQMDPLNSIQIMSFSGEKTGFPTQKNEALLDRIVTTSSLVGERVLDPFCGSGTTAAVSHKRGRRWITIEVDPASADLAEARLRRIVAGEDLLGISGAADFHGGGGFVRSRLG